MASKRAWETYPQTYRAREMRILAHWIRAGESGSVVGLAGSGKSNLFGFLCHRPQVMTDHYLEDRSSQLALVLVDLNNLPQGNLSTFYRVVLRSLYEARSQLSVIGESLPQEVEDRYRKAEDKADPFLPQSALREILLSLSKDAARLVMVLDPFDHFCRTATTQVLDNLRGLRDGFKATLSYIVGLRHELAYVRAPDELGELYEILDTHVCWVGSMQREDARWVVSQVEEGMGRPFGDEQIERLIDLTGAYPALLRSASLWLAQASPVPDAATWERELLADPGIQSRLQDLWRGLTGEEQAALSVLHTDPPATPEREHQRSVEQIEEKYHAVLTGLEDKHICIKTGAGWGVFSPLFARFVASVKGISAGRIWHDPKTDRFFRGEGELTGLSEQDRRLLRHFLEHPLAIHSIDDLIGAAWAEYESSGVSDMAVQQAIRHLRTQIEMNPARPCYLVTQHGAGYRFFPEGAPQW